MRIAAVNKLFTVDQKDFLKSEIMKLTKIKRPLSALKTRSMLINVEVLLKMLDKLCE
jgi:hypothetical protein